MVEHLGREIQIDDVAAHSTNLRDLHSFYGTYSPQVFVVRASANIDLRPNGRPPSSDAVACHVHEYVHMLHNLSTISGLRLYLSSLWLLRTIAHAADYDGHFRGPDFLTDEQKRIIGISHQWTKALYGNIAWESNDPGTIPVRRWAFESYKTATEILPLSPAPLEIDVVAIRGSATSVDGDPYPFTLNLGHYLITEGVAYEVDREVRRHAGLDDNHLDDDVPQYPYLIYRELLDYFVGRPTSPMERIEMGICGLLTTSPAKGILDMCHALTQLPQESTLPECVSGPVTGYFQAHAMDFFEKTIRPEVFALSRGPALTGATDDLTSLILASLAIRTINPLLEKLLTNPGPSESFLRLLHDFFVDYCVIQERDDGEAHLLWIGRGIVAGTNGDAENFARLQSLMHFAKLHLSIDGTLLRTAQLGESPCPFSGACRRQLEDNNPSECRTRPWTRFLSSGKHTEVCWYAAGVKLLARDSSMRYPL